MSFTIEGRQFYLRTAGAQTVNICQANARPGQGQPFCEYIVRLNAQNHVTEQDCRNCGTIANLLGWLHHYKKGRIERPVKFKPINKEDVVQPKGIDPLPPPMPDKKWLDRARKLCEAAIDEFVDDFLESPYRHRVEHSLHCMLYTAIASHVHFQGEYSMADGTPTQLVHKEWPETVARPGKRRGNFDLAILSPVCVEKAHLAEFTGGRVVPSLIIEVGLDYDDTHFDDDRTKLANSLSQREEIEQGYLIHFVREKADSQAILRVLEEPGHERISTAYARVHSGTKRRKLLSEAEPKDIP